MTCFCASPNPVRGYIPGTVEIGDYCSRCGGRRPARNAGYCAMCGRVGCCTLYPPSCGFAPLDKPKDQPWAPPHDETDPDSAPELRANTTDEADR